MLINIKLDKDFEHQFDALRTQYGETLAKLNGFAEEQLSYTDFIDNFIDKNTVADASIDGNANAGTKDICSLESEMSKPHSKLLSFNKIYYEMFKAWGKEDADEWLRREWDGHYYLHDAASASFKSYCFAYDLDSLVRKGLFFINNFNASPAKHLVTYTDFVGEMISYTSNRSSGACGLPSFLVYSYYYWRKDVNNKYFSGSPEIYRDQEFQRIVYKLNQPYLRINQSAFTNFSIYDRPYFTALFGGKEFPDGSFMIDCIDEFMEYQKAFMNVVSEIREQNMMTFPVLTFALLRNEDGTFADEEFAKWCCKHNMKWADSNFFISKDVTSLSNCCFDGGQRVNVKIDGRVDLIPISMAYERAENQIIQTTHKGVWKPCRVIRLPARQLYKITTTNDAKLIVTDNHINPTTVGDKLTTELTTADALLSYVGSTENTSIQIADIQKVQSNDSYVYCFEMLGDEPYFTLPNGIITHNCRLVSDVKNLGYFNSIGGSALEVGSIKVNTINLARIAYESKTQDEYCESLRKYVILCCKTLHSIRHIIQRNIEKGLLPNYTHDLIHLKSQYNTIGIIGIYETLQKFNMTYRDELGYTHYTDEGIEFAKRILSVIDEEKNIFARYYDYSINIEQIPAERAAAILMQKDKLFFPDEIYELPLYGNQWIPLGVKTTIEEKVRLSAILDKACNGGSIAHINIDAPFNNFETAWKMLNYVADSGVPYFAFCTRISACDNNHGFYGETCPTCGQPKTTTYQRIVG